MEVVLVLFKSDLPKDKVIKNFEERADLYRTVPGLVEKYHIHDESNRQSFQKNLIYSSSLLSAEWIVERPILMKGLVMREIMKHLH
jgi:hypothetical protein